MKAKPIKNMAMDIYQQTVKALGQNIARRLNVHIVYKKDNEFRLLKQEWHLATFSMHIFCKFLKF